MAGSSEAELLEKHRRGRFDEVAAGLVERYGSELFGFLINMLDDRERAQDAFQATCEDVLRGLPGFRGASSFRTWLYTIARHRALKLVAPSARREVPLSRSPEVERLRDAIRSATQAHLRTEVKQEVRRLRAALTEDERALLVLRIDRAMDWSEIAAVLTPELEPKRGAARLRKRFERTKERLRKLAAAEGLVRSREGDP